MNQRCEKSVETAVFDTLFVCRKTTRSVERGRRMESSFLLFSPPDQVEIFRGILEQTCLIDFQTMELYALQEHNRSYYIRDYYVQIHMDDSGAEVNVFYMPVLAEGRKEKCTLEKELSEPF